ncbi:MAG: endospore germination permease [Bacilli bacterium]|nr:endospore germination permease [Bacilli bacterium]
MNKQLLTEKQIIVLIILFLFGSSVVIGIDINSEIGQDAWISLILSFVFNIPLVLIFGYIINKFPQKNIYQIIDILFGKLTAKILISLFLIHILYLGSIVLRNFSEYVEITTLSETPLLPIMMSLILISVYLSKSKIKTLGIFGNIVLAILLVTISITLILSFSIFKFDNIKPILNHSINSIFKSSFKVFMLPFSELIVMLGIADLFDFKNPSKTYLKGIIFTGIILDLILIRNITVIGIPLLKDSFFASYQATRILQLGEFLTRVEGLITINFVLAGIVKITIFIISLSKGVAYLTKNKDYTKTIFPVSLLMLGICPFLFDNVVDLFDFAPIFGIYAIPIQVILPIIIFLFCILKKEKKLIYLD